MMVSRRYSWVFAFVGIVAGSANATDWTVAKVSQPSRFTVDQKNWQPLSTGMTIPNRSWISTGPRGRVMLQREKDKVTFEPGTLAGVFEKAGLALHTDFAQQTGTLKLDIDPQVKPHLAVQTPYLAAVVKGTRFSVSVNRKGGASVGVERGRVEVTDPSSGERTGVTAGQKASVDTNPKTHMALTGKNRNFEAIVHVTPFQAMVPVPPGAVPPVTAAQVKAAQAAAAASDAADASEASATDDSASSNIGAGADNGPSSGSEGKGKSDGKGDSGKGGSDGGKGQGDSGKGGKGDSGKGDSKGDSKGGDGKGDSHGGRSHDAGGPGDGGGHSGDSKSGKGHDGGHGKGSHDHHG